MTGMLNILQLVKVCGRIEGRKKFQKIVHILQEAGYPFHEDFGYLHYGPYSSDLKREIDQLVSEDLIDETPRQAIDYQKYEYTPTQSLNDLLHDVERNQDPEWASLARRLNDHSAQKLEALSTILYLQRRNFCRERLTKRFKDLKPSLTEHLDWALQQADQLPTKA